MICTHLENLVELNPLSSGCVSNLSIGDIWYLKIKRSKPYHSTKHNTMKFIDTLDYWIYYFLKIV